MFEISLSIAAVVFLIVAFCCSFLYSMNVCGTIVVFILRTMTKSLIIVDTFERSPVRYCYFIAHVRKTHPSRSWSDKLDLRKRSVFFRIWRKRCLLAVVYKIFDLLSLFYCIGYSATVVYSEMQTMCTLYERHTCSMCMRNKTAQQCRNCRYIWSCIWNKTILLFIDCCFLYSSWQSHVYHNSG